MALRKRKKLGKGGGFLTYRERRSFKKTKLTGRKAKDEYSFEPGQGRGA